MFVNLPSRPTSAAKAGEFYVGSVNSFSISAQEVMHPGGRIDLTFPLSDALKAQARAGELKDDSVTVSFVRYGLPKGVSQTAQFVKIGKVVIEHTKGR